MRGGRDLADGLGRRGEGRQTRIAQEEVARQRQMHRGDRQDEQHDDLAGDGIEHQPQGRGRS